MTTRPPRSFIINKRKSQEHIGASRTASIRIDSTPPIPLRYVSDACIFRSVPFSLHLHHQWSRPRRYRRIGHFLRSRLLVCLPRCRNDAKMMWQSENVRKQADALQLQEACHRLKASSTVRPCAVDFVGIVFGGCQTTEARSSCKVSPSALVVERRQCLLAASLKLHTSCAHFSFSLAFFASFSENRTVGIPTTSAPRSESNRI